MKEGGIKNVQLEKRDVKHQNYQRKCHQHAGTGKEEEIHSHEF